VVDGYAALITSLEAEGAVSRELEQLPTDTELQRRKALGLGLTAPELAVVIANVKNRFKRVLAALPLTELPWAETVLRPYFPAQLVATRKPLAHPLANAILATVLANEAVNRCGPLMLRDLAAEHRIDEAEVVKAWGQRLVGAAPGAGVRRARRRRAEGAARRVDRGRRPHPRAAARRDRRRAVAAGRAARRHGRAVATCSRSRSSCAADAGQVGSRRPRRPVAVLRAGLEGGRHGRVAGHLPVCRGVGAASGGMSLAQFLQVGMALRERAGIDTLERGLKLPATSKSQEQLRNYAMQALRRTQQRLLLQVLERAKQTATCWRRCDTTKRHGPDRLTQPTDLEQAMLNVWSLSEGSSPERMRRKAR
jgi:glutamate dehydrogenase